MKEQAQSSVNLGIPSRGKRFSAYLLDLIINLITNTVIIIITYRLLLLTNLDSINILFGIVIAITVIFNVLFIIIKRTTLGNESVGIITLNNENKTINGRQSLLRFFIFNPAFLALILLLIRFFIALMLYMVNGGCGMHTYNPDGTIIQDPACETIRAIQKFGNRSSMLGLILFFISTIELFFKCPTFIDKRLGIKRIYKKNK